MERLISLFREADYEQWSPSHPQPPPREHHEPLYFQELLEYLRKERGLGSADDEADADTLVGLRARSARKETMVQ